MSPLPAETFIVGEDEADTRLDVFCAERSALSRSQVQKCNDDGRLTVDGRKRPHSYKLSAGESVELVPPDPADAAAPPEPEDIPISIVYQDDDILVVNKAAGMVVHPAYGNESGTLVNAVLGMGIRLSTLGAGDRPGIVHRLDKDTSGVMVVAKTDAAYQSLSAQMKSRDVHKVYHAITWGSLGRATTTIDEPIIRHPLHRQKMSIARRGGREALTEVFVVDTFEHFDYSRVVPLTGRTHQIRVHLAHISHPILGDSVYGGRHQRGHSSNARVRQRLMAMKKMMPRQALHASKLSFVHPTSGQRVKFQTALPEDMRHALELLHSGEFKEAL